MTTYSDVQDAAVLRDAMTTAVVAQCGGWGFPLPAPVEAALRTVPRHLFAPEVSLEKAYARDIVEVKRSEQGRLISTMSAPEIQAMQLVQADIGPGMRVLEVGSGGYNAALIAEIAGPTGQVTTMDIDPDVTSRARRCLDAAGYPQVRVVTADAEHGWEDDAPYDLIMVTVGAWDIPPSWREQLAERGRIVVPLRMRGITRSLALERTNDHLVAVSQGVCGFVKMQGVGAHEEDLWLANDERIGLRFDDGNLAHPDRLDGVFAAPPAAAWSGVTVASGEPFPDLPLWMATALPGFCNMIVNTPEGEDCRHRVRGGRPVVPLRGDRGRLVRLPVHPAGSRRGRRGVRRARLWPTRRRGRPIHRGAGSGLGP